jgi:predicted ATPase
MAQRVGCSASALRKLETGERRPSLQIAELLANALDLAAETRPIFLKVARGVLTVERLPAPGPQPTQPAPPAPAARPAVDRLPVHPTPLVGRQRELAELGQLLADPACRLLTLVGPGGVGKTRLAIRAARQFGHFFADGVAFVPLAPLTSTHFIVPAIAQALGFGFSGPAEPQKQLQQYLYDKHLLLIVDNVEHLLLDGAAEMISDLQAHARCVTLLITSREALDLRAEWVFEVHGLPVPEGLPPDEAAEADAVELFLQRARRADVGFRLVADDLPAIQHICQLVAGLPLAIELAASWVRTLNCAEIAAELERGLDLLTTSARDVPARHRSMRAAFDHSWKLLPPIEQHVLQGLSVFRGSFTREAAEHVTGAGLPLLSSLAAKSLIRRAPLGRYDLHELLRDYAAAHLAADATASAVAYEQHCGYFLALAEAAEPHLKGSQQIEWFDRLEHDHDNLRAALEWSLMSAGDPARGSGVLALRLATALGSFWRIRGHFYEGYGWLTKALQQCPASHTALRARALEALAMLANPLGDHEAARVLAEESAALFREMGDRRGLAEALTAVGLALGGQGHSTQAQSQLAEALALYLEVGDRWGVARNLYNLGEFRSNFEGDAAGRALLEESLAIVEDLGDRQLHAGLLISLGMVARDLGDYPLARARLERALVLGRDLRQPWTIAYALTNLGGILNTQGDHTSARSHLEEALRIYQERGNTPWAAGPLCALAEADLLQGNLTAAGARLREAAARTAGSNHGWLQVLMGYCSGLLAYYEDDAESAAARLEETAALAREGQYLPDLARSLIVLGRVWHAQGDAARATALLREGLCLCQQMNNTLGAVTALEALAALALATQPQQAAQWLGAAEAARTALGTPLPPVERPALGRALTAIRTRLDERTLSALWAEGQAMRLDEAITRALHSG